MRRFRISIAGLLGLVALTGVSIAALTHPSPLAGNAFYTLALCTLILSVLTAIYHQKVKRAFWVGFSACGWAYFLMTFGPGPLLPIGQSLVTTTILNIIYPYSVPSTEGVALHGGESPALTTGPTGGRRIILTGGFTPNVGPPAPPPTPWEVLTKPQRTSAFGGIGSPDAYRRIGHSLFCLAFATIGGVTSRRIRAARDPEPIPPT